MGIGRGSANCATASDFQNTGCFTKGYRKLYHYKTYIYMNILMKLSQNIHHMNKFLLTEFFNRTPYI